MFSIWTGLNNFFHDTPSHPQQKYSKMHPTTSVWINSKQTCVFAFLCLWMCVGATIFKSSATTSWFDSAETHIREQRCSNPWIFPGPARRDQEFTERSKRTKGQQPKNGESKPGNPWTKRKKIIEISGNHFHPHPHPPKKVSLGVDNGSPSNGQQICRLNVNPRNTDGSAKPRQVGILVGCWFEPTHF